MNDAPVGSKRDFNAMWLGSELTRGEVTLDLLLLGGAPSLLCDVVVGGVRTMLSNSDLLPAQTVPFSFRGGTVSTMKDETGRGEP